MATQLTLNDGSLNSAGALKIKTNGTTEAVDISTGQVVTLAKDAVVNGLTVGKGAGAVSTNTAVGASALSNASTTGTYNIGIGTSVGVALTSGVDNIGVGGFALTATTTGGDNIGVGVSALRDNTTGSYNIGIGTQALRYNTTASYNTAVGYQAGYSNTASAYNTFVGAKSGYSTTGASNAFFGDESGYSTTTGIQNTFIGQAAGYYVSTGSKNTIIGQYNGNQSGLDIRTASNYIVLSDGDGNPRGIFDSSGNLLVGTTSALDSQFHAYRTTASGQVLRVTNATGSTGVAYISFRYGSGGTETGYISTNGTTTTYSTSSDYRLKENVQPMQNALATVAQLKPCTYTWKADGSAGQGFIAHELQEVVPDCVTGVKDAVETYTDEEGNEQTRPKYQGIDTSFLVATLTAAIQEQQQIITQLQADVAALKGQA